MPTCTFCCKLRCLISIVLMVIALLLLSMPTAKANTDEAQPVTQPATGQTTEQANVQSADDTSTGEQAVASLKNNNAGSLNSGYLMQLVAGLMVVLLCIVVLAWFAKRFNRLQTSSDGSLEILGGISMGARERVVLVRVGEQQVLLGVSPGRINALHVLDARAEQVDEHSGNTASTHHSFADKLQAVANKHQAINKAIKDTNGRRFLKAGAE